MHYSVSIDIDASPQQAWAALTDVESYPRWTRSMTTVRCGEAGELEVGSTSRVKQPWLPRTVWTVTRLGPERSFTWQSKARGVTTIAGHHLSRRVDGGVTVALTVDQHGPLAKALSRFTAGLVRLRRPGSRRAQATLRDGASVRVQWPPSSVERPSEGVTMRDSRAHWTQRNRPVWLSDSVNGHPTRPTQGSGVAGPLHRVING